jgi:hypothetical protein
VVLEQQILLVTGGIRGNIGRRQHFLLNAGVRIFALLELLHQLFENTHLQCLMHVFALDVYCIDEINADNTCAATIP